MSPRLTAAMQVSALIRRVHDAGGSAMVLARGDATAGAILLLLYDRGARPRFVERGLGPDGATSLITSGPQDIAGEDDVRHYWQRRRARDADLWVVELDIAEAERFAAETMALR
jgi:hypothetical protein